MYAAFKHIHMTLALISIIGFLLRSVWAFNGSAMLHKKLVKIVPHIIDTFLLVSAVVLMVQLHQYPITSNWLTGKLIGLVAYIIFATFTIKKAKGMAQRSVFFALSLVSIAYLFGVAFSKNALFFL